MFAEHYGFSGEKLNLIVNYDVMWYLSFLDLGD